VEGERLMTRLEQYTDTEERASDHSAQDEEEEAYKRALMKAGVLDENGEVIAEVADKLSRTEICSCGFFTCPAISTYGHPVPLFKSDIEPLYPQMTRDVRALELKGAKL
jgi:hypothetical protein